MCHARRVGGATEPSSWRGSRSPCALHWLLSAAVLPLPASLTTEGVIQNTSRNTDHSFSIRSCSDAGSCFHCKIILFCCLVLKMGISGRCKKASIDPSNPFFCLALNDCAFCPCEDRHFLPLSPSL